jgi:hypothetical protein
MFQGDTANDARTEEVTVNPVAPATDPELAWICAFPGLTAVASPEPVIVAAAVFVETQDTLDVMSEVLPSESVPLALNCWVRPFAIDEFAGVTVKLVKTGDVTMN